MTALAQAGPHVAVKISMLVYIDPAFDKPGSKVPGMVHEVINLFGPDRCVLLALLVHHSICFPLAYAAIIMEPP
jgi:hypothetical protein